MEWGARSGPNCFGAPSRSPRTSQLAARSSHVFSSTPRESHALVPARRCAAPPVDLSCAQCCSAASHECAAACDTDAAPTAHPPPSADRREPLRPASLPHLSASHLSASQPQPRPPLPVPALAACPLCAPSRLQRICISTLSRRAHALALADPSCRIGTPSAAVSARDCACPPSVATRRSRLSASSQTLVLLCAAAARERGAASFRVTGFPGAALHVVVSDCISVQLPHSRSPV